jgi:hypothetical protein
MGLLLGWILFVKSIRSPVTKEKYLQRMGYFFDYLNIPVEEANAGNA